MGIFGLTAENFFIESMTEIQNGIIINIKLEITRTQQMQMTFKWVQFKVSSMLTTDTVRVSLQTVHGYVGKRMYNTCNYIYT